MHAAPRRRRQPRRRQHGGRGRPNRSDENLEECRIVPTVTGSLVTRCKNSLAVRELLKKTGRENKNSTKREDTAGIEKVLEAFEAEAAGGTFSNQKTEDTARYVKYDLSLEHVIIHHLSFARLCIDDTAFFLYTTQPSNFSV